MNKEELNFGRWKLGHINILFVERWLIINCRFNGYTKRSNSASNTSDWPHWRRKILKMVNTHPEIKVSIWYSEIRQRTARHWSLTKEITWHTAHWCSFPLLKTWTVEHVVGDCMDWCLFQSTFVSALRFNGRYRDLGSYYIALDVEHHIIRIFSLKIEIAFLYLCIGSTTSFINWVAGMNYLLSTWK